MTGRGSAWPPSTPEVHSLAAAHSVARTTDQQRAYVLSVITEHGPIAEWQIEERTGLGGNSIRPRIWELMKLRRIAHRGTNRTPKGRKAHLYVAIDPVAEPEKPPRPIFGQLETGLPR
jgi:hypothetical protein